MPMIGAFFGQLNHVAGSWNCPWVGWIVELSLGARRRLQRYSFSNWEKGGCSISTAMHEFNGWIRDRDLCDLPLRGAEFMWSNMQQFPVMSRLDWFLVSTDWLDIFPDSVQRALARLVCGHCPLLLEIVMEFWGPFKFEIMCLSEKGFSDNVKEWCDSFYISGWMGHKF